MSELIRTYQPAVTRLQGTYDCLVAGGQSIGDASDLAAMLVQRVPAGKRWRVRVDVYAEEFDTD